MELRVIVDGPRDPRVNMAIDEAILLARSMTGVDTLRIYMWRPTGVSLGRAQPADAVNLDYIEMSGYILVRRPTGGRALLHVEGGEITYSLVASSSTDLYKMNVADSARTIAEGVAEALRLIGLDAHVGGYKGLGEEDLCYLREGASDVTVGGLKVSGSAQVRTSDALLQHGTLLLDFNPSEWVKTIRTSISPDELASRVTSLRGLGIQRELTDLVEAIIQGFTRALGYEAQPGSLTPKELGIAEALYRLKYSNPQWNIKAENMIHDNKRIMPGR